MSHVTLSGAKCAMTTHVNLICIKFFFSVIISESLNACQRATSDYNAQTSFAVTTLELLHFQLGIYELSSGFRDISL